VQLPADIVMPGFPFALLQLTPATSYAPWWDKEHRRAIVTSPLDVPRHFLPANCVNVDLQAVQHFMSHKQQPAGGRCICICPKLACTQYCTTQQPSLSRAVSRPLDTAAVAAMPSRTIAPTICA